MKSNMKSHALSTISECKIIFKTKCFYLYNQINLYISVGETGDLAVKRGSVDRRSTEKSNTGL